ncbi:MAG TPA: MauE/DoxX family redox-associated membrane protein [Acidimicrobiales bacterium]
MRTLAGPYVVAAALLALGGLFKVRRPAPTARALRAAGLAPLARAARLVGVAEVAVGLGALAVDNAVLAGLVAAFYLGFAAFVGLSLIRQAPVEDCGCFGGGDSPPSIVHLVLDGAAAAVAAAIALGPGGMSLPSALEGQPLAGVPFLALTVVVAGLAYATLAVLPRTLAALKP